MPHTVYLFLHLAGVILLSLSIGGNLFARKAGETKPPKLVSALHGVGLLLLIVAGFGMIARLDIGWPFPIWIWSKIAIWLLLGGFNTFSKKLSLNTSWILAIGLFLVVAYLGVFQPF